LAFKPVSWALAARRSVEALRADATVLPVRAALLVPYWKM
jgi:hypothetical protein